MARLQRLNEEAVDLAVKELGGEEFDDPDQAYQAIKLKVRVLIRDMATRSPLGKKKKRAPKPQTTVTVQRERKRATGTE